MTELENENNSKDYPHRDISKEKKDQSELQHELVSPQSQYHGPLPPPQMLQQYEKIHPGTADLILQQFKEESNHRQSLERRIVKAQVNRDKVEVREIHRGQLFALIIGVLGLLVGGMVALFSRSDAGAYSGACIGGATLVGLVTTFIVGHKANTQVQTKSEKIYHE